MSDPHYSELFPSPASRSRYEDKLTHWLGTAHDRVSHGAVTPTLDMAQFAVELGNFDFQRPRRLDETILWVIEQLEHGLVHVPHPRYFGLFNPTPTYPAQCADRIAAIFNPQLATATTSPVAVAIENHVVQAVAQRAGLPAEARGHFTTGGAEANYTALILALTAACPAYAEDGMRAFAGPPVFYASRESHLAWLKIAHQAGIGRSAVRLVATDGTGRLNPLALQEMLREDRARGCVPVMLVATAGTTNAGMIDPLEACADIAAVWKLWYHVDAAWGGGLIASDQWRSHLSGIEAAHSVTIDAHKWFAATMGCGIFITARPALLGAAFHVLASYMPSNAPDLDPYVTSVQWSRRFLGLRLFLSLAAVGWTGYGVHVEQSLGLITLLREQIAVHGWTAVNRSPAGVLCLMPPDPALVKPIVRRVVAAGVAWVSTAVFEGRDVVRVCVTSGLTTTEDISVLVTVLHAAETGV